MNKLTTKIMEHVIYDKLWQQGRYLCFEVKMPNESGRYMQNDERVDLLSYETGDIWRFFELKLTKSDFHSKNKVTFLGNFNYYVVPGELYYQIKDEIPDFVGVYVIKSTRSNQYYASCEKKAKRQELKVDSNLLMFSLMQSLSRENQKWRKVLKSVDRGEFPVIRNKKYMKLCENSLEKVEQMLTQFKSFDFCKYCGNKSSIVLEDSDKCVECYRNQFLFKDNFELSIKKLTKDFE